MCQVVRGCPCPVAGRSLRASCPPLTRMPPALRHPGFAWRHTPAPGHGQPLAPIAFRQEARSASDGIEVAPRFTAFAERGSLPLPNHPAPSPARKRTRPRDAWPGCRTNGLANGSGRPRHPDCDAVPAASCQPGRRCICPLPVWWSARGPRTPWPGCRCSCSTHTAEQNRFG